MKSDDFELDSGSESKFSFEDWLNKYKFVVIVSLIGLILIGLGIFYIKKPHLKNSSEIEVLNNVNEPSEVVVEIAGEVMHPGLYKFPNGARIDELIIKSGGLNESADKVWFEKTVNRAAVLVDGYKLYVPSVNKQKDVLSAKAESEGFGAYGGNDAENRGLININTASQEQLDTLPGIGPVYAQNIIEHRPYSTCEELVSKGALKKGVYEKVKDQISAY